VDIVVVIAIIVGPILAIQVQKFIERITLKRQAKEAIFKTLMSTRGTRLSLNHVQALNMIDLEFYGKQEKNKNVVDMWRLYLDQLSTCPRDIEASDYNTKLDAWNAKSSDAFHDMLFVMATTLGYKFDKVLLKRGAYRPTGYGETENEQILIRRGLAHILLGSRSIPIHIVEAPPIKEKEDKPKQESKVE